MAQESSRLAVTGYAGSRERKLDIEPLSGESWQTLVRRIYAAPRTIVECARLALAAKPQQ